MRDTLTGNEFSASHRLPLGNLVLFIGPIGVIEAIVCRRNGAQRIHESLAPHRGGHLAEFNIRLAAR